MSKILSSTTSVKVLGTGDLPGPGQAVHISANLANDIKPSTHDGHAWNYALMNAYGGGAFVKSFSPLGAYVIAGTGGHNANPNFGAAAFDFSTRRWVRLDNANGMPWRTSDIVAGSGEYNSEGEIQLSGVTPNSMPLPSHTYMHVEELPAPVGGTRGSIVLSCSLSGSSNGNNSSSYSHRFDLETKLWSRLSTNRITDAGAYIDFWAEGTTVFDHQTGRLWAFTYRLTSDDPIYLDPSDWTWKSVGWEGGQDLGWVNGCATLDPKRRLVIWQTDSGVLRATSLDAISSGLKTLTKTGSDLASQYGRGTRWAYVPDVDAFFAYSGSGQVVHKIKPPAGDPLAGAWTVSTLPIGGATLASSASENQTRHYTRFFYVPGLKSLAWVASSSSPVTLIGPF